MGTALPWAPNRLEAVALVGKGQGWCRQKWSLADQAALQRPVRTAGGVQGRETAEQGDTGISG